MTWQSEIRAWALATAGVFCLSTIGYRVLTAPDITPVVTNLNAATGQWAAASKQQAQSVSAIERDIRAEIWHVDRVMTSVDGTIRAASVSLTSTSDNLNAQLTHIGPLLDSARAATDAVPVTLGRVDTAVSAVTPVLNDADATVIDFKRFINGPTIQNVDSMTASWAGISADARKVADKTTADYLKPVPWYLWPVKRGGELLDIGAAVARHTP